MPMVRKLRIKTPTTDEGYCCCQFTYTTDHLQKGNTSLHAVHGTTEPGPRLHEGGSKLVIPRLARLTARAERSEKSKICGYVSSEEGRR